ncbi:MAG: cellulose binding domain-containing protein [Chloroflexota bacterium]
MKQTSRTTRLFSVLILLVLLTPFGSRWAGQPIPAAAAPAGFVYRCGVHFCLDGKPYYFAGTNVYDFFTFGDGSSTATQADIENRFMDKPRIDAHMARLQADGVGVVRLWMFSHETWHGFEPAEGVYNEAQFMLFDYIIESAKNHGIKLLPVFENYWEAYGGIDTRLEWEGLTGGHPGRAIFFNKDVCPGCFSQYKNYVQYVLNRTNHYSGIQYKNEPTIFAWELMNEPRYQGVSPEENVSGATLRAWVDEMGAYIKAIDSNHMLGTGLEAHESRFGFGGDEGNPFIYIHQSEYIDFTSAHPYPTEEWADLSIEETRALIRTWINESHDVIGKPFFMGEFNSHTGIRTEWWEAFFGEIEASGGDGSAFWWYADHAVDTKFGVMAGAPELAVFRQHAAHMTAKSGPFPSPTPTTPPDPTKILKVQYLTMNTGATSNQITAYMNIVNTGYGLQYVPLHELTVRYWFTTDTAATDQYGCLYAIVGCSNVNASFTNVSPAQPTADRYLELSFSVDAGTLAPYAESGAIQARINKNDWSDYTQTNDYSFDGAKTAYTDWNRITLYRNGQLIWGVEPGNPTTVTPTSTPLPTDTPQTPPATATRTPSHTPTPSISATVCPLGTPEPLWVEPVTSPTKLLAQEIVVRIGNSDWVRVVSESGTYTVTGNFTTANPARITIPLLADTTHNLRVTGHVKQVTNPNGCSYGGYTLSTTYDRDGAPLTIVQGTSVPTTEVPPSACRVSYTANQWGNGFTADVKIINNGSSPIQGWTLTYRYANGQQITSAWNATVGQSGANVTASNPASHWNGTIPANGGSVSFGIQGTHTGTNEPPLDFALNGIACNGGTLTPTHTPTPTATLTRTPTATPAFVSGYVRSGSSSGPGLAGISLYYANEFGHITLLAETDADGYYQASILLANGTAFWPALPGSTSPSDAFEPSQRTFDGTATANDFVAISIITPTPTQTATPTATPTVPAPGACQVAYTANTWNSGFTADVKITNNGSSAIQGWTLTYRYANGQQVTSAWNATVSQSGANVTASNPSSHWNGTIPANGGSVSFGIQGTHNGTNAHPTGFSLNGVACTTP